MLPGLRTVRGRFIDFPFNDGEVYEAGFTFNKALKHVPDDSLLLSLDGDLTAYKEDGTTLRLTSFPTAGRPYLTRQYGKASPGTVQILSDYYNAANVIHGASQIVGSNSSLFAISSNLTNTLSLSTNQLTKTELFKLDLGAIKHVERMQVYLDFQANHSGDTATLDWGYSTNDSAWTNSSDFTTGSTYTIPATVAWEGVDARYIRIRAMISNSSYLAQVRLSYVCAWVKKDRVNR